MATVNPTRATPDDLMRTEGKAELIGGKVVEYMATGMRPNEVAANIYVSLASIVACAAAKRSPTTWDSLCPSCCPANAGPSPFSPDTSY